MEVAQGTTPRPNLEVDMTLPDSIRRRVLDLAVHADLDEGVAHVKVNGGTYRVVLDTDGSLRIDTATLWGVVDVVDQPARLAAVPAQQAA